MDEIAIPAAPPRSLAVRIVNFPVTRLVIGVVLMIVAAAIANIVAQLVLTSREGWAGILRAALIAVILIGGYLGFTRFVERRGNVELAWRGWLPELLVGLAIGGVLFSIVVGIIALGGGYQIIGTNSLSVMFPVVGLAIVSGVSEEILLRGLFFRLIEEWLGSWAALLLSAALFGALHLGNTNASLLAGFAIALEAGVMLAAIFMITRRLWAAIGVHAGWNFVQGGIYGIAISGNATPGLLRAEISGSDLLTGGAFGAEASLPAIIICTAFGIGLIVIAQRRGQVLAPLWVRNRQRAGVQS